jgi:transcriptional regulator with XRE-family HTH domain
MPYGKHFDISDRIKQVRGKKKKAEFARILGIPQPNLSKYESGRLPPADILQKVADYGEVSVKWLLTGEEEEQEEKDLVQPFPPEHFPKPVSSHFPPFIQEYLFQEVLRVFEDYQKKLGFEYDLMYRARILVALYNHCAFHQVGPTVDLAEDLDIELTG